MHLQHKQSTTAIIVVHEIYGVNHHIHNFCQSLRTHNFDIFCPNLFNKDMVFNYYWSNAI